MTNLDSSFTTTFQTIDLATLDDVTGGAGWARTALETGGGMVGGYLGGRAGAALGGAAGTAVAGPVGGAVGAYAGGAAGGMAGEYAGQAAGGWVADRLGLQ